MDRGVGQATVHGVTKELDMTEQLNTTKTALNQQMEKVGKEKRVGRGRSWAMMQSQ